MNAIIHSPLLWLVFIKLTGLLAYMIYLIIFVTNSASLLFVTKAEVQEIHTTGYDAHHQVGSQGPNQLNAEWTINPYKNALLHYPFSLLDNDCLLYFLVTWYKGWIFAKHEPER